MPFACESNVPHHRAGYWANYHGHMSVEPGLFSGRAPLAAAMRPRTLEEVQGQDHLLTEGSPLRTLATPAGDAPGTSVILWGLSLRRAQPDQTSLSQPDSLRDQVRPGDTGSSHPATQKKTFQRLANWRHKFYPWLTRRLPISRVTISEVKDWGQLSQKVR